jgi:hypothetical protein
MEESKQTWLVSDDISNRLRLGCDTGVQRKLRTIVAWFQKSHRPMIVGPLAIDLGITLRQLQLLIDVLVDNNVIRVASHHEMICMGLQDGEYAVYTLK